jgi:hypothetical protein
MMDESETIRVVEPRLTVRFDSDGTWSAWRGAIPLASGLPTVTAACDALDRAASASPPATPIKPDLDTAFY